MLQPNLPSLIPENMSSVLFFTSPVPPFCLFCKKSSYTPVPTCKATSWLSCLPDMIFFSFQYTKHIFLHFPYIIMSPHIIIMYILHYRSFRINVNDLSLLTRFSRILLNWIMQVTRKSYYMERRLKRESGC